jgi:hypothetical protein
LCPFKSWRTHFLGEVPNWGNEKGGRAEFAEGNSAAEFGEGNSAAEFGEGNSAYSQNTANDKVTVKTD